MDIKMKKYYLRFIFLAVFFAALSIGQVKNTPADEEHLIKNEKYRQKISEMLVKQQELAKNREMPFNILKDSMSIREREALEFLLAFMPLSDLADYDGSFYLNAVRTTLRARNEISWLKSIPEEIFLHFVLPLRVNNENLDTFRSSMYEELKNRVKGLTMKAAALEINHWCHEKVTYRPSDGRTSAPMSSMKTSWGRCGEESVFSVNALRTVGIPARQVYTPRWAHTDDNHAWVEVWIEGKWYFLGACEPDPDLDMGWFAEPSRRTMVVHTRAFGKYYGSELVITSNDRFSELNLITNYAPAKKFFVKVFGEDNNPVENAKVEYRLYNYSEFFPLAKSYTDKSGYTNFTTGLGDLLIWANKDGKYGFRKITIAKIDTVKIKISSKPVEEKDTEWDLVPPLQPMPKDTAVISKKENQCRIMQEDSIRQVYDDTFRDSAWTAKLADNLKLDKEALWNIFKKAYGNWSVIQNFLEKNNDKYHDWLISYLGSFSDKDIRDIELPALEDHLLNGFDVNYTKNEYEPGFYSNYVLSPRIGLEYCRPWRSFLQSKFDKDFKTKAKNNISVIVDWIKENIKIDADANMLSRCPLSPKGVLELKVSDSYSRSIFFVALCRSLGLPSRLNPVNNIPQYFNEKKWKDILFEKKAETKEGKGYIRFVNTGKDVEPRYYSNFTIGKLNNGVYETLEFDEDKSLGKFDEKTEVDEGRYMLVTGNRLKDGTVLSAVSFYDVKPGTTTDIKVKLRAITIKPEKIGKLNIAGIKLNQYPDEKPVSMSDIIKAKGAIFIWIDPDKEPSKHVMNDLPLLSVQFNKWGGNFLFLLSKENLSSAFNPEIYKKLPLKSKYMFDTEGNILKQIEKIKKRNMRNNLPLIIACDKKGNIIFLSEGYTIGIGDQLAKIIGFLK
jgi:hypothetical protein